MTQILIVEDEQRIASFVARGLRTAGYATHVEDHGSEVAGLAASGEFDLVILDVGCPMWTGSPSCGRSEPAASTSRSSC